MGGLSVNLVPSWAPNVHPLIVHFPIALLLTAAGLDVAALALRCNRSLRFVATALYVLGSLTMVAAYFTGRAAAETIWLPGMAHAAVKEHWDWALRTVWFFGILTMLRLAVLRLRPEPRPALIALLALLGLLGVVMLVETGDRGGRLVYQHGVGIVKE
jgi:uncharacterized membrane protein